MDLLVQDHQRDRAEYNAEETCKIKDRICSHDLADIRQAVAKDISRSDCSDKRQCKKYSGEVGGNYRDKDVLALIALRKELFLLLVKSCLALDLSFGQHVAVAVFDMLFLFLPGCFSGSLLSFLLLSSLKLLEHLLVFIFTH